MSTTARTAPTITRVGSGLPSRVIYHGTEGVGKTSFAAHAPQPIFAMTRGETGLLTLIDNGLVGETAHFNEIQTWPELLGAVDHLISNETPFKTFVLDTLNGAERLCFEHNCQERFEGSWRKFEDYGKGPQVSCDAWIDFLSRLDRLRERRRMAVIALCHTRVKTFKNPEGPDYDRYSPDMNDKTWGLAHKWADVILFGNFLTFAEKDKSTQRVKGHGGAERIFYTTRTSAWDAKNRNNLPSEIPMGTTPQMAWANFLAAMKAARQQHNGHVSSTITPSDKE